MFNPPNDYYEEYIEIYNLSDTASVDLTGFLIGDQVEQDSIIDAGEGLILPPNRYALILDSGYWENSLIYDSMIPDEALVLTIADGAFGSGGLRNSAPADTVKLINPAGDLVAEYSYIIGNADGISEEKIILTAGDVPSNWANSQAILGTPGFTNSVTPVGFDLAIRDLTLIPSPQPFGSSLNLAVTVENPGIDTCYNLEIEFGSGALSAIEAETLLGSIWINEIVSQDSLRISMDLESVPSGAQRIFAWLTAEDDNPDNNTVSDSHFVGYPEMALVINEIMAAPAEDQSEWIELYNRSAMDVELMNWMIADANLDQKRYITSGSIIIPPEEYCILAQDSSIFAIIDPSQITTLVPQSWPVLNNTGDSVAIFDVAAGLIDLVAYEDMSGYQGISLERIYPDAPSGDPANWQICYDSTGSTPGEANSYGEPPQPQDSGGQLSLTPDPFDPDTHGSMQIQITMPFSAASVTVSVYDLRGRQLSTIFEGSLAPNPLLWDGRDRDHRRLIPGPYIMLVEFKDQNSVRDSIIKKVFVVAGKL